MNKTTVQVSAFTLDVVRELKKQLGSRSADVAILTACKRMVNTQRKQS